MELKTKHDRYMRNPQCMYAPGVCGPVWTPLDYCCLIVIVTISGGLRHTPVVLSQSCLDVTADTDRSDANTTPRVSTRSGTTANLKPHLCKHTPSKWRAAVARQRVYSKWVARQAMVVQCGHYFCTVTIRPTTDERIARGTGYRGVARQAS